MSGFLYYVEGGNASTKPANTAALAYLADDNATWTAREVLRGPFEGAGAGCVLADARHTSTAEIGLYPDKQTWAAVPGEPRIRIGRYTESPLPGPVELRRAELLRGHIARLGDGRKWTVPVARAAIEADGDISFRQALPCTLALNEAGEWAYGAVVREYAALWEIAGRHFDYIAGNLELSLVDKLNMAVVALQANYLVGPAECGALGLFDDRTPDAILRGVIDWPTWVAWIEKKTRIESPSELVGSNSSGGAAD